MQVQLELSKFGGEKMTKQQVHSGVGSVGVGMMAAALVNTVIVYDPKSGWKNYPYTSICNNRTRYAAYAETHGGGGAQICCS